MSARSICRPHAGMVGVNVDRLLGEGLVDMMQG